MCHLERKQKISYIIANAFRILRYAQNDLLFQSLVGQLEVFK